MARRKCDPHPLHEVVAYWEPQSSSIRTFLVNLGAASAPVERFENVEQVLLAYAASFVFAGQGVAARTQAHDPARLGILHGDVEHCEEDLLEPLSANQYAAVLALYAQLQTCGERERLDTLGRRPRRLEQPHRLQIRFPLVVARSGYPQEGLGEVAHPMRLAIEVLQKAAAFAGFLLFLQEIGDPDYGRGGS